MTNDACFYELSETRGQTLVVGRCISTDVRNILISLSLRALFFPEDQVRVSPRDV